MAHGALPRGSNPRVLKFSTFPHFLYRYVIALGEKKMAYAPTTGRQVAAQLAAAAVMAGAFAYTSYNNYG